MMAPLGERVDVIECASRRRLRPIVHALRGAADALPFDHSFESALRQADRWRVGADIGIPGAISD